MPTLAGSKHLQSISSSTDRVFSVFRQEKYGSNPSEMDIKVIITDFTKKW